MIVYGLIYTVFNFWANFGQHVILDKSQSGWQKTFWSCRKNNLIRKISLISKFLTSQPGSQTVTIHILPNISQNKGNKRIQQQQNVSSKFM